MTLDKANLTVEQLQQVRDRPLTESYAVHDVGQELLVARLEAHGFEVEQHGDDARHAEEVFYGDGPDLAVYSLRHNVAKNDNGLGSTYIDTATGQFVSEEYAYEKVAYIEIKCKESPEWFGRVNLRHYREYVNFANETDVPVFLWFALVDQDDVDSDEHSPYVRRQAFVQVEDTDQIDGDVVDVSDETLVFDDDDIFEVNDEYVGVQGSDVLEVRGRDTVVEYIPDVHGNEVITLNDNDFRSWPHFLFVVS